MSLLHKFPRIKKLSAVVVNQIAAGEVIERPASVVKELIENSIDALANNIQIDIEQAGNRLIRVHDDGHGLHKEDLELALTQHSTSKLSKFTDLQQIASLGFRGEAIPSIASVSQFKLISRPASAEQAWSIDHDFKLKPAAHDIGTTVEVQELFFSTPVRRKFLKSEKTEYLHIQSLLRALALSHFSIGFFVKHNQQSLYRFPDCKDNFDQRVLHVCGRSFLEKSILIDKESDGLHLWGWLGLSELARSQSDRQYFYVNGRMVRDKHVNHAIRLVYADRIAIGRFPSYILHLHINPAQVDVNVHPAKTAVRFAEPRTIHDFIYGSLLECLNKPMISIASENNDEQASDNHQDDLNDHLNQQYSASLFKQNNEQDKKLTIDYFKLLDGQFIIATIKAEPILIDVARARALLTAQYLLKRFHAKLIVKRPIMIPLSVELEQDKLEFVSQQTALIVQWGFVLEQISPSQISICSLPSRLFYADAIAVVKRLIVLLKRACPPTEIASQLANHVNDAGVAIEHESVLQLLNEISVFEQSFARDHSAPWRRFDQQALAALLDAGNDR